MPRNLFKIYDGRNYFLQWDTEQRLIVLDPTIKEVHFSNHDMKHAITKDVIVDKDGVRVCPIPDALLMLPKNLIASANVTDEDGVQRFRSVKFGVRPRQIPSDYIVTEDFYFEDFNTRLRFLEEIVADGCLIHRFESIEEAEQWAQNSKEIGSVISVQTADGWMTYTVEKDLSVKPVCDCDEEALIRSIDALKDMIGDSPVNEQIQSVIDALDLANTYEQKGASEQALTQAKEYADSLSKNYDKAGAADAVQNQLDAEIERARNEEAALSRDIRATDKKVDSVQEALDAEIARATNEDKVLNEVHRQVNDKVVAMQNTLDTEVQRSKVEDEALNTAFRQLNDRVVSAQGQVNDFLDYVGELPPNTSADTIVEYVDLQVQNVSFDEEINELNDRIDEVESTVNEKIGEAAFVSYEAQELTDEQKLQAQNNISFIKWYRFIHPYSKQVRQFSYDDSFDMDIANSILNVTGYGDNCSAMEDVVDYIISILFTNTSTEKDLQDIWLRAIKTYIKPNFDALQEIGCFKGSTFCTYLNDTNTKFYVSKENAIYELTISGRLRDSAKGYARYDSSTDTLTHFTINNLEWDDTTLTQPNYHANAKAVGDALALKIDKSDIATDDEIIEMLIAEDMFPVVTDTDCSLLADENGNILLW